MQGTRKRCVICRSEGIPGVSLFQFPADEERRQSWADFCQISVQSIKSYHRVCSRHFSESSFKTRTFNGWIKKLKEDAMPTIAAVIIEDHASCSQFSKRLPKYRMTAKDAKGNSKSLNYRCLICGPVDRRLHRFSFPRNPNELAVWLDACGLDQTDLRDSDRLCEAHFETDDINICPKLSRLEKGAFPSKLLPTKERAEPPEPDPLESEPPEPEPPELVTCDNRQLQMEEYDESYDDPTSFMEVEEEEEEEEEETVQIYDINTLSCTPNDAGLPSQPSTSTCGTQVMPFSTKNDRRTPAPTRFPQHIYIKAPVCGCSERTKIVLDVARRNITTARSHNELLKKENIRLRKKVESLRNALNELRSKTRLNKEAARSTKVLW